jgi:hypothetical protein
MLAHSYGGKFHLIIACGETDMRSLNVYIDRLWLSSTSMINCNTRSTSTTRRGKREYNQPYANPSPGVPASQSLQHITKSARSAAGKEGGVTRIAYLTAIAPAIGDNLVATISINGAPKSMPPMDVDEVSQPLFQPHPPIPHHPIVF